MINGSNIDIRALDDRLQGSNGNLEESLQSELELILQVQRNQRIFNRERGLNMNRSGSAPPTVEGSLSAVGGLFRNSNFDDINSLSNSGSNSIDLTEDEIRSHPAYLSYYYSHDSINPRLPPPLLSKEDWRVAQRFQAAGSLPGSIGDLRTKKLVDDGESSSLFSMQPGAHGLSMQKAENELMELRNANRNNHFGQAPVGWLDRGSDGLIGLHSAGLGARRKSFADIVQEGLDQPSSLSGHLSRPSSRNAFGGSLDIRGPPGLGDGMESLEGFQSGATSTGMVGVQGHGTTLSHSFASAVGSSLSRSTTPEHQLVGRSPSSGLPPLGSRVSSGEKNAFGATVQSGHSSGVNEFGEISASLSGLNLSQFRHADQDSNISRQLQLNLDNQPDLFFNTSNGHSQSLQQKLIDQSNSENISFSNGYTDVMRTNGILPSVRASKVNGEVSFPKRTSSSANLHSKLNSFGFGSLETSSIHHQKSNFPGVDFTGHVPGAHSYNQKLNSLMKNHLDGALGGGGVEHSSNELGNQGGPNLHSPVMDPRYALYLQKASEYATHAAASSNGPQFRNYFGTSHGDLDEIQKAYLEANYAQRKQQHELPLQGKSSLNQGHYRNSSHGLGLAYPGNSVANSLLPSVGFGSFQNEQVAHFTSMIRNSMGGPVGSWPSDIGSNAERRYVSSLLDEFKNNKSRSFELSDIVDHVIEFSMDQYGSRFIQQKLETASLEEKNKIFPEIIPYAHTLMTDVFGNYVIQKFFEHGTESQRRELASQLAGHVLPLSLQMYGCRVIQKALEAVDVDEQASMVAELDGSIMKCVRDQNGNHVIQKCIEHVPEDRIQFIISAFYGQVVALSTHPYGCRVIQRVLEHCHGKNTHQIIMDEIMQSVCTLAQDQYGNYVIQHVLEHGQPHERSTIISQLAGQIVKMSQQKFASNVVEKCLTFGGPEERQLLVNEMLGSTDENEPLQAMMKDPFGNYVVQKVLETCDDKSLELILSRIKVHLSALKKYTYGKHIVSRVEKLITAGEKRISLSTSLSSQAALI